jgi:hypothetical protein
VWSLTGAFLPGKPLKGEGLRLTIVRYVFVLLLGLVFGFVLQSVGFCVSSVDKLVHGSDNVAIGAYGQGVSYVR